MAQLLTNREMELFRMIINLRHERETSKSRLTIARDITKQLTFPIDSDDIIECCEIISGQ